MKTPPEYKLACDLNWGELKQLIDNCPGVTDETRIDTIGYKGASNVMFTMLNEDGEIISHD